MQVAYRDYTIRYYEDAGLWSCEELDVSAGQLAALKELIDGVLLDLSKFETETPVWIFSAYGSSAFTDARVTRLDRDNDYCWVAFTDKGKQRRSKERIESLIVQTPENLALVEEYKSFTAQIEQLQANRRAAIAMCTRLDLSNLVKWGGK